MTDTTPALDDLGAALAARLQARTATRGLGTARRDPASRAWSRTRDDSGAPGASPRRARLLSRVMEGFGTALPAWDRWGPSRGDTVLRVLGEAYILSPDGFVWVVPQAEDAPEEANVVSGWARPSRRASRPSVSLDRPARARASQAPRRLEASDEAESVLVRATLDAPEVTGDLLPAQVDPREAVAPASTPARPRRRGRAVARAAARAVPSRGAGRARPMLAGIGQTGRRGAADETTAGWAPIAAAHARLDAPDTVRRALPTAAEPTWLTAPDGDSATSDAARSARWGTPTGAGAPASGATRSQRRSSTPAGLARGAHSVDPIEADLWRESEHASHVASRPLARAARRSETLASEHDGLTVRSILPRAVGGRGSLGGLATPRTRPSRAAEIALVGLDASTPAEEPARSGRPAALGLGERGGPAVGGTSDLGRGAAAARAPDLAGALAGGRRGEGAAAGRGVRVDGPSEADIPVPSSPTTRALHRAARADAARAAETPVATMSTALAAPPMSWIRSEPGAPTHGGTDTHTRRPGPVDHAQRRAAAGPVTGFYAPTGALVPPSGSAPDAFADAVRARRDALAPVRSAAPARNAPDAVLLDGAPADAGTAAGDGSASGAARATGLVSAGGVGARAARARPTSRLRDRGASPEERRAIDVARGVDGPVMTLAEVTSAVAQIESSEAMTSPARGGHVTIAAWRRALSAAPKDVASALASSPELGAKVVAAMRQMKALPAEEAKPLHARTAPPSGVTAPAKQQEARREKTAAALATLRGSPMRTRADRPSQTRLTRLASKLEGLVHLAESEQREAEAQRWVRRASEPAETAGAATAGAGAGAGAQDMSLDTLQREVLEAVVRELERAQERGEGIGHATADW